MLCHAHGPGGGSSRRRIAEGTSSTGRASVSKTEGWGFKSLVPCEHTRHTQTVVGQPGRPHETRKRWTTWREATPSGRVTRRTERTGPVLFYRQVVAELRKVVWPTQQQLVTYFFVVMVFVSS